MEGSGTLTRRRKGLRRPGGLPDVVVADITGRDRDGDLVAMPNDWNSAEFGVAPRIVVDVPRRTKRGAPAPGVGDRVLLRVATPEDDEADHLVGRVVKVLPKHRTRVLGVFSERPDIGLRVFLSDRAEDPVPVGATVVRGRTQGGDSILLSTDVLDLLS